MFTTLHFVIKKGRGTDSHGDGFGTRVEVGNSLLAGKTNGH